MSSIDTERIKGVRQYTGQMNRLFEDFIPFGTDGQFIDMASELDLEEELILGGYKKSFLKTGNNKSIIIEKYYDLDGVNVQYTKKTVLKEDALAQVIEGHSTENNTTVIGSISNANNSLIGSFVGLTKLKIQIFLYKGHYDESQNGQAILTEGQDYNFLFRKVIKIQDAQITEQIFRSEEDDEEEEEGD